MHVLADVPVVPDADEARRWAVAELADPIYHRRPSLLQTVWDWVLERLAEAQSALSGLNAGAIALVVAALVALVVVIALIITGPVRTARRGRRTSEAVFVDDERTAAELRASADALAAQGRWSEAVLDRYRAVVRSLEERALLDPRPGRTAHEAAIEAAALLPACAGDLDRASRLFDDVCYGDIAAGPDDDAAMREVDTLVLATRPDRTARPVPVLAVPR